MLGVVPQPAWTRVVRHVPGIPQYDIGHLAWLDRLDAVTATLPGLYLAGWGYRGIGISSLAKHAAQLGELLLAP